MPATLFGARAAIEGVIAGVAIEAVVQGVAGAGEAAAPLQHQHFYVRRQNVADRGEHRIGAFVDVLEHRVAGIVDKISVVAGSADHRVGARPAVEQVVAGIP